MLVWLRATSDRMFVVRLSWDKSRDGPRAVAAVLDEVPVCFRKYEAAGRGSFEPAGMYDLDSLSPAPVSLSPGLSVVSCGCYSWGTVSVVTSNRMVHSRGVASELGVTASNSLVRIVELTHWGLEVGAFTAGQCQFASILEIYWNKDLRNFMAGLHNTRGKSNLHQRYFLPLTGSCIIHYRFEFADLCLLVFVAVQMWPTVTHENRLRKCTRKVVLVERWDQIAAWTSESQKEVKDTTQVPDTGLTLLKVLNKTHWTGATAPYTDHDIS